MISTPSDTGRTNLLILGVILALSMLLALSGRAQTSSYTAFTVKTQEGTWVSYALDNLKITFSADNMTVSNKDGQESYAVSDLYSMLFTDEIAGIKAVGNQSSVVSLQGAQIRLNVEAGTQARVYDANGRLVATTRIGQEGAPTYIGSLSPGIYIIRAAKQSCKVLVK